VEGALACEGALVVGRTFSSSNCSEISYRGRPSSRASFLWRGFQI
jgi:hypothetical protein